MSNTTDRLGLNLLSGIEILNKSIFNDIITDIDKKCVGIAHLQENSHWALWKKDTFYSKGDIVRTTTCKSNQYFQCIISGTSGDTEPINKGTGAQIKDKDITWIIYEIGNGGESNGINIFIGYKYYTKGQPVMYNGLLYRCIKDHIAKPAFQNDIENWQRVYSNLRIWTSNTRYFIDDIVTDGEKIYFCSSEHISSDNIVTDIDSWKLLGYYTIDDFTQKKYYNKHDLIVVNGDLYRCNNGYTSTTDLIADINNWEEISGINEWTASQPYIKGNITLYGNRIYVCNKSHTSTTDFDLDKLTYWSRLDDNPIINDWTSGEQYEAGAVAIMTNINGISEWKENTSYKVGDSVIYNGYVYTCSTANNDATFTENNWTLKEPIYNRIYRCITSNKDTTFDASKWQLINGDAEATPQEVEDLLL